MRPPDGGTAHPLKETARLLGAFYDGKLGVLHATGFVVKPDRTIAVGQYSSGPIGRLVWQDVLGLVQIYNTSYSQAEPVVRNSPIHGAER